jgi:hypothetical protein
MHDLIMRAPEAGVVPVPRSGELFVLTLRHTRMGRSRFFDGSRLRMGEVEVEGSQMAVESFTLTSVDVGEALQLEAFHADRDVITKAESWCTQESQCAKPSVGNQPRVALSSRSRLGHTYRLFIQLATATKQIIPS